MRIAIDIRCLTDRRLTGVGLYTLNLVHTMAAMAPDVHFVLFASGTNATLDRLPRFHQPNIQIIEQAIPNKILSGILALPIGPALEDHLPVQPDVWFFPHPHILRTRLPYVVTIHDLTLELFPQFFTHRDHLRARLSKSHRIAQHAQKVITVSNNSAKDIADHWKIDRSRLVVTPLGYDNTIYLAREQASDRSFRAAYDLNLPYILSLCTLEPRKNIETVIEAYDAFRREGGKRMPLVIAGGNGWKTRKILETISASAYAADIRVLGYVPEKHKPALYRGAETLLFPSFYEGFGLPVLEAMACGTPVVTSFTSSLPEVAGNAALYVDPFNVSDLVQALHALFGAEGQVLRSDMRQRGIQQAARFSWRTTAKHTLEVLRAVIAQPPSTFPSPSHQQSDRSSAHPQSA